MSVEQAGAALKHIARLVNGTSGDGSMAGFDLRAGIRRGEGSTYWVGFNAPYWGYLFELVLMRYGVPVRRSSVLPGDGPQPSLKSIASRPDVYRTLNTPLTDDEEKASAVDEALDLLGHAARGAWRRRRRR
jgi:hypothetical protein